MKTVRLSQLQGMAVFARDGRRLGHVLEVRSPGAAETEPLYEAREIGHVLAGRPGLLDRLGWIEPDRDALPWGALDWRDDGLHVVLELPPGAST
jgi:hypothetical protein